MDDKHLGQDYMLHQDKLMETETAIEMTAPTAPAETNVVIRKSCIFEMWQKPVGSWMIPMKEYRKPVMEWEKPIHSWLKASSLSTAQEDPTGGSLL